MRKKFAVALSAVIGAICCLFGLAGCFPDKSVTYKLNDDGESYCLSKVGRDAKKVVIPETYEGLPVTRIASGAFTYPVFWGNTGRVDLDMLEIPQSIEIIESCAFVKKCYYNGTLGEWLNISFESAALVGSLYLGGELLENLKIPDGMTEVPACSFSGCQSLKSVEIPEGVEKIGDYTFSSGGLKQAILPHSLRTVGAYAFYSNDLISFEIPEGVENVGDYAFSYCGLKQVMLPHSLKTVGSHAFYRNGIEYLTLPEGLISVGERAFAENVLTELTIPSTLAVWGEYAFDECQIEKLNLTDGLRSIGAGAFRIYTAENNSVIEEVTIPQSVETIKFRAFYNKKILKLNLPCEVDLEDGAFKNCSFTEVSYAGTKEQWDKIKNCFSWNGDTDNYVVHCADGDIEKNSR